MFFTSYFPTPKNFIDEVDDKFILKTVLIEKMLTLLKKYGICSRSGLKNSSFKEVKTYSEAEIAMEKKVVIDWGKLIVLMPFEINLYWDTCL